MQRIQHVPLGNVVDGDGDGEGDSDRRIVECSDERRKAFWEVVQANGEGGHQPHVMKLLFGAREGVRVSGSVRVYALYVVVVAVVVVVVKL